MHLQKNICQKYDVFAKGNFSVIRLFGQVQISKGRQRKRVCQNFYGWTNSHDNIFWADH